MLQSKRFISNGVEKFLRGIPFLHKYGSPIKKINTNEKEIRNIISTKCPEVDVIKSIKNDQIMSYTITEKAFIFFYYQQYKKISTQTFNILLNHKNKNIIVVDLYTSKYYLAYNKFLSYKNTY